MIFPQFRQLGAGVKSGWMEALQEHFRRPFINAGFVETSSAAMAAVKSAMLWVMSVGEVCVKEWREGDEVDRPVDAFATFDLTFGK